jgi:predicted nuclease of predicted toxin-antitoxin system
MGVPRLRFLADHNVEATLTDAVAKLKGYRVERLAIYGLQRARDPLVKEKARELQAVILTRDGDYLDPVTFRICTHPGVLHLDLSSDPEEFVPQIRAFLTSRHFKRCRHTVVRLGPHQALVQTKPGGPLESFDYLEGGDR